MLALRTFHQYEFRSSQFNGLGDREAGMAARTLALLTLALIRNSQQGRAIAAAKLYGHFNRILLMAFWTRLTETTAVGSQYAIVVRHTPLMELPDVNRR